jgi:hypothetical protein
MILLRLVDYNNTILETYRPGTNPSEYTEALHERIARRGLPDQLAQDFRLSFRYSGSESGQHILFYLMGLHYREAGQGTSELANGFAAIPEETWLKKARPPQEHQELKPGHLEREALNEHAKFETAALSGEGAEVYGELLIAMSNHMIQKDLKQMVRGRPNRSSPKKQFASFTREYVLGESSTGSPTFNAIFRDMRQLMLVYPPEHIVYLATLWKVANSESFYPQSFLKDAGNTGTREFFTHEPLTPKRTYIFN